MTTQKEQTSSEAFFSHSLVDVTEDANRKGREKLWKERLLGRRSSLHVTKSNLCVRNWHLLQPMLYSLLIYILNFEITCPEKSFRDSGKW